MINSRSLFHPLLLRSFVAVAEENSFSRAARRLHLRQSTLSQHISKLEDLVARELFWRTTRQIMLSPAGEILLEYARAILATYERAQRSLHSSTLEGRIRLGASEEFAIERLAPILSDFKRIHERVELAVTIATSGRIEQMYDQGELDLMVVERQRADYPGYLLCTETVGWFGRPGYTLDADEPVPVILPAAEHVIRDIVLLALEQSGHKWRETCTAESYLGLRAAALAGLGVTALSSVARPVSLELMRASANLPQLADIRLMLVSSGSSQPSRELEEAIRSSDFAIRS